ncbi:MAG: hypothetical protein Q8Q12_19465 [bacterium]|nr:hypothetical protein [bacterium]
MFDIYGISELDYAKLNPSRQSVSLVLVSELFSMTERHLSLFPEFLRILVASVSKDPNPYVEEAEALAEIDWRFNEAEKRLETSAASPARNVEQQIEILSRTYTGIVEGLYSIAMTNMAFAVSVLKSNTRTVREIERMPLRSRADIVSSYNPHIGAECGKPYVPVVRNAASHGGIDTSHAPRIVFTDKMSGKTYACTCEELGDLIRDLFRLASMVATAVTIKGIYPDFVEVLKRVPPSKYMRYMDIGDIMARMRLHGS